MELLSLIENNYVVRVLPNIRPSIHFSRNYNECKLYNNVREQIDILATVVQQVAIRFAR